MTDKNLTEIIFIMDRSGSMSSIRDDAIGGFNQFLKDQQNNNVDNCRLTYVQFDTEYDFVHENTPIKDVPPLNEDTYQPRGMTALLDAVGRTIEQTGKQLEALPEDKRPGAVLVCILTDGQENSSRQYTKERVREMVERQTDQYNWQFLFLGADQDAFTEGGNLGIQPKGIGNFKKGAVMDAMLQVSNLATTYRTTKTASDVVIDDDIG